MTSVVYQHDAFGICLPPVVTFSCGDARIKWEQSLPRLWEEYYRACGLVSRLQCGSVREASDGRIAESGRGCLGSYDGKMLCGSGGDGLEGDKGIGDGTEGTEAHLEGVGQDAFCGSHDGGNKGRGSGGEGDNGKGFRRVLEERVSNAGRMVNDGVVRGKHYKKNKSKALRRAQKVRESRVDGVVRGSSVVAREYVLDGCDDDMKKKFADSRAKMLIAENEARRAKAESYARHMSLVAKSRVNETKFELDRQTVEEKLQRISARRLGLTDSKGMPLGKVETIVSDSGLGSYSSPSMTSGSISPNSSISMQEVNEMKAKIELLALKEAEASQKLVDSDKALSLLRSQLSGSKENRDELDGVQDSLNREKKFLKNMNAIYEYSIPQSSEKNYSVGSYDGPL